MSRPFRDVWVDTGSGDDQYALILRQEARLLQVPLGPYRILYIGDAPRGHPITGYFDDDAVCCSCPRRSLGALLRHELRLQVRPRARGHHPENLDNFRFDPEGEKRLTHWLRTRLCIAPVDVSALSVGCGIGTVSSSDLDAPLNLHGAPTPFRRLLLELRASCRDDARAWSLERQ